MTVAIDTMVLILGSQVARKNDPELEDMRVRSRILFHRLDEDKDDILVPAIVLSEYLAGIAPQDRLKVATEMASQFKIQSFDVPACAIAADLWDLHKTFRNEDAYAQRPVLLSDMKIIAIAKAAGATCFYSFDKKAIKLGQHVMKCDCPPKTHPDMFVDKEIREGLL